MKKKIKLKRIIRRFISKKIPYTIVSFFINKYSAEAVFWKNVLKVYVKWYRGEIEDIHGCKHPDESQKAKNYKEDYSALLTWNELFQKKKYLFDLDLKADVFKDLRVLDIGSGPIPGGLAFKDCELYCLDPLIYKYMEVGYPIHIYGNTEFINAYSEDIPFEDNSFDVVISVNALDHVDDFEKTASEIRRVLKKDGKVAFHIDTHKPTITEPLELNEKRIKESFSWCKNFKKVKESVDKYGWHNEEKGEKYLLYRNF